MGRSGKPLGVAADGRTGEVTQAHSSDEAPEQGCHRLRREWSEGAWPRGTWAMAAHPGHSPGYGASLCWVWVRLAELRVNVDAAAFQLACRLYPR